MTFEVLLSCMHQNNNSLITNSNLENVNVLMVNQCDVETDNTVVISKKHRRIDTNSRGLSVSRNIAINNSKTDICILADDDEAFVDNLENTIVHAYQELNDADIILFNIKNLKPKFGNTPKRLRKLDLLKACSIQITFKREKISGKVKFDEKLGAGTKYGSGEETRFLLDCYKNGLKIYSYPVYIAELLPGDSTWFSGYDGDFFLRKGSIIRYNFGLCFGFIYCIYTLIFKHSRYKKYVGPGIVWKNLMKGFLNERI